MAIRLVLLDRDGVLNVDRADSVKSVDELVMIEGAAAAVARLNRAGIKVAIVTNQANVGRGLITMATLEAIHAKLYAALDQAGASIDALFVAPDAPDQASDRRKPGPGMLLEAMAHFGVSPGETVFVGDAATDAEAAKRAGVAFHLARTGKGAETEAALSPSAVHDDLAAAVDHFLGAVS